MRLSPHALRRGVGTAIARELGIEAAAQQLGDTLAVTEKHYVMPSFEGPKAAVTAIALAYEEGKRRAEYMRERGAVKWLDLPASERFNPITVFVDEFTALSVTDKVPTALPKDHPLRIGIEEENLYKVQIFSYVSKIMAEQRAHGVRVLVATQVTNQNTGVPPTLKSKIGHKLLQGSRQPDSARKQIFSEPDSVPKVPDNVAGDSLVSKGTGSAELEGQTAFTFKSYYSTPEELRAWLESLGIPKTTQPCPDWSDVERIAPSQLDVAMEDVSPRSRLETEGGFVEVVGKDKPLRGAAAAAHQLALDAAKANKMS